MSTIDDWSTTAAANGNSDANINFAERQTAGSVNDSSRVVMARAAEWRDDLAGTVTTTGSSNAYLLQSVRVITTYTSKMLFGFTASFTNTGSATLNIRNIGAKTIYSHGAALTGNEIKINGKYWVIYDTALNGGSGGWHLMNANVVALAASVSSAIDVTDNSNPALRVTQKGTANALLVEDSANPDSTPWLVDASGQVVHGHTAALTTFLDWAGTQRSAIHQIHSLNYAGSMMMIGLWPGAVAGGPTFGFGKTRGSAVGTYTVVNSGDNLGTINWMGADGTDFALGAQIMAEVDGTPGAGDMPTRLLFKVSPDGSETPATALTISSTGKATFKQGSTTAAGVNLGAAASADPASIVAGDMWWDATGVHWGVSGTKRSFNANLWTISELTLAAGGLIYANAVSDFNQLAIGTAKQVLKVNAGATAPEWANDGWAVILAEQDLSTGVASQTYSVDFSTYEEVIVYLDSVQFSGNLGASNFNVFTAITGTSMAGFQRTGDGYIGTAAVADRYGGKYHFNVGNVAIGGSYYQQSGRAENCGYDASVPVLVATTDALTHINPAVAGRPNQILITNGGAVTVSAGKIRIVGRRRSF